MRRNGLLNRWRLAGVALALGAGACVAEPPKPDSEPEAPPSSPSATTPGPASSPWTYAQTALDHAPSGIPLRIVAELERPTARELDLVVAMGVDGRVQLSRWTFDHRGPNQSLAPASAPTAVLRVQPNDPAAPEHLRLHQDFVAPRNRVNTRLGLSSTPAETLQDLKAAAVLIADTDAPLALRVDALARAFRGVDTALTIEQDALAQVLEVVASAPADAAIAQDGTRRARASIGGHTLEFMKRSDGWVVSALTPR